MDVPTKDIPFLFDYSSTNAEVASTGSGSELVGESVESTVTSSESDGESSVEDGESSVEDGESSVEDGESSVEDGESSVEDGEPPDIISEIDCESSVEDGEPPDIISEIDCESSVEDGESIVSSSEPDDESNVADGLAGSGIRSSSAKTISTPPKLTTVAMAATNKHVKVVTSLFLQINEMQFSNLFIWFYHLITITTRFLLTVVTICWIGGVRVWQWINVIIGHNHLCFNSRHHNSKCNHDHCG
jgi:hypothetical protein